MVGSHDTNASQDGRVSTGKCREQEIQGDMKYAYYKGTI